MQNAKRDNRKKDRILRRGNRSFCCLTCCAGRISVVLARESTLGCMRENGGIWVWEGAGLKENVSIRIWSQRAGKSSQSRGMNSLGITDWNERLCWCGKNIEWIICPERTSSTPNPVWLPNRLPGYPKWGQIHTQ